jgi:fermentation-respiration switch protein FrsA (DUF1100 family)
VPYIPPGSRHHFEVPERWGISSWEEVFFPTEDGETLQGWLVKAPRHSQYTPTLIWFHSNAGNISHRLPNVAELINEVGINIFLVEYRGYGKSSGVPSEEGTKLDAIAAYRYLTQVRTDLSPNFLVFGRSLGGAVAIDFAVLFQTELLGVILENTFTSIPDLAGQILPLFYYFTFLQFYRYMSIEKIRKLKDVPVLFVSGLQDEVVPPSHMQRLFDQCDSRQKSFKRFREGRHMETWTCSGYNETIRSFTIDCLISRYSFTSATMNIKGEKEQDASSFEVLKRGMLVMDFVVKYATFSQRNYTLEE